MDSFLFIYYADFFWIFGYIVHFTLGLAVYSWISIEVILQFMEAAEGEHYGAYILGPVRRMVVGWTMFWINIVLTMVPGVNFVAGWLMYEWAKADYYDYNTRIVPIPKEERTE